MTSLEFKGDWNIAKGKLKQKWAMLTDNDVEYVEGMQEEMLGRIQKLTGASREAVVKVIKESTSLRRRINGPPPAAARIPKDTQMKDHVYKLIELTGTSTASIEDAIDGAIKRANKARQKN